MDDSWILGRSTLPRCPQWATRAYDTSAYRAPINVSILVKPRPQVSSLRYQYQSRRHAPEVSNSLGVWHILLVVGPSKGNHIHLLRPSLHATHREFWEEYPLLPDIGWLYASLFKVLGRCRRCRCRVGSGRNLSASLGYDLNFACCQHATRHSGAMLGHIDPICQQANRMWL